MRKLILALLGCLVMVSYPAIAQTVTVSGKISDASGNPVAGASVLEKGTRNGVSSDASGFFSISVKTGATLEITAIGFESVEVAAGSDMKVTMQTSTSNLNEVIVTGVGAATSRKKVAIDVGSLAMKNAGKSAVASVEQALQGQIAGATVQFTSGLPGASAQIVLRGLNDLAGTGPIVLVDGVEIKTGLTGLDLSAVDRVEVVKGAAAGTLYGAQGAGGVIQIFTKRGAKTGRKPNIDIRQQFSSDEVIQLNDLMAANHHFVTDADGFITRGGVRIKPDANGAWPDPSFMDAGLTGQAAADVVNSKPYREPIYDHLAQAYRKAKTSNTNLNITGGNEFADYSFNMGFLNQENVLYNGYKRYNLGANLGFNLAKGLTLRSNTQVVYTDEDLLAGGSRFNLTNSWRFIDFTSKDVNGNITVKPKSNENQLNPLSEREWRTRGSKNTRVMQNFNLNYKFPRFVELDYKYGYDYSMNDLNDFYENQTGAPQSGSGFWGSTVEGSVTSRMNKFTFQNSLATAYIRFDFDEDFKAGIPLTSTTQVSYDWRKTQNRQYFAQGLILPTFPPYNINVAKNKNSGSYDDEFVTFGTLVNQTFDWGNLFGVSAGLRSDYSSDFGEGSEPQNFFRGSAYFRPSEFIKAKWLSDWKLRGAYGEAGIQPYSYSPFARQVTLDVATIGQGGVGLVLPSQNRNAALKVQQSKELELGTDFTIRTGGKEWIPSITVSATWWNRTSEDVIQSADQALSTGFAQLIDNLSTLKSNGMDFSVDALIANKEDFRWNFGFRLGKFTVKADEIANNADIVAGIFSLKEGEKLGTFYAPSPLSSLSQLRPDKTPYIPEAQRGNYELVNGMVVNKASRRVFITDPNDQSIVGSALPDFNASFLNTITLFQNFTVGFQLDWRKGNEIYNLTRQWLYRDRLSKDFDQKLTINGQYGAFVQYYNSLYNNVSPISWFVEDGSYLRLRDISLTYQLHDKYKPKWLRTASVTLAGRNLLTKTNYSGLDPESTNTSDAQGNAAPSIGAINGVDYFGVPNLKSYQFILSLGF